MASLRCAACLTLLTVVVGVTPIQKVITLIEGLQKEVEDEGKEQAAAYEKIACYCKENTEQESADILKGNDKIEKLSAEIGEETQVKKNEEAENSERSSKGEALKATLDADVVNCNKDRAEYEKNEADMAKAISSLNNAIESMQSSKPADDEALDDSLDLVDMGKALTKSPILEESTKRSVETLLQLTSRVDPDDPEFSYHSDDIIQLMQSLRKDFRSKKSDLDDDWKLRREACKNSQESEENQIATNDEAIEKNKGDIEKVGTELAEDKEALVGTESTVTGDKKLLKEITVNCEARAKEFDEHSKQRNDEIAALSAALQILTGRVKEADKVNGRATEEESAPAEEASAPASAEGETEEASAPAAAAGASFLQMKSSRHRMMKFLARRLSPQQRADRSLTALRNEGRRINSLALLAFTARAQASADWADKLKNLMDKLLNRLVEEAKAETDQKAFCDKNLGMARKDVNNTWEKVNSINSDLVHLEAKTDELTESTEMLKKGLEDNTKSKAEATENRDAQKAGNAETLKVAKEGLAATTEALAVLNKFYGKKAALLQERQEPAGAAAPMQRKQSSTGAIFGLLQGIESDFDRTIRNTEAEEEAAEREFQELVTTLKADIKGKETDLTLDKQDLKGAGFKTKEKTEDLKTNMGLLDKALQEIEKLKPACIDTGMSYEERVQKRETEMEALKNSLCLLDPDQVEEECQ